MSTDAIAYRLFWDCRHRKGAVHDVTLVPFHRSGYVIGWKGSEPCVVPTPALFEASVQVTRQNDYPCNDSVWPLMSPRMLDVLRQVGDFPHRLIPVRLVNRKTRRPGRKRSAGRLQPEVADDRFVGVQLTEHIDVVDWERSRFEWSQVGPAAVYDFDELVLVEPPGGLPPLFRVPSDASLLLVSAQARRALESAGIQGVAFDPLPGASKIKGRHGKYSLAVMDAADKVMRALVRDGCDLEELSDEVLRAAAVKVRESAGKILEGWEQSHLL
jgi:hypothetical protein